ncbi:hypothetical protein JCM9279_006728 [Rhodotorula babjevae]
MPGPDLDLFTTPLPDHLHCPVCFGAAYPPVIACSSEHILCSGCVVLMRQGGVPPECPTCREVMPAAFKISLGFKRAVESYSYKCEMGQCEWVGSVGDVEQHLQNSCDYRLVECSTCALKTPAKHLAAHARECPEAFIFCPRGGMACTGATAVSRDGTFRRRELPEHDKVCSMFRCSHGCHTYTTAANLSAHEKGCAWSRSRIEELERKLALSELQLARSQKQLKQAQSVGEAGPGPATARARARALERGDDDDVVVEEQPKRKRVRYASGPDVLTLGSSDDDNDDGRARNQSEASRTSRRRPKSLFALVSGFASDSRRGQRHLADSPKRKPKEELLID